MIALAQSSSNLSSEGGAPFFWVLPSPFQHGTKRPQFLGSGWSFDGVDARVDFGRWVDGMELTHA